MRDSGIIGVSDNDQIANAHTLFNVVNTSLFIWFTVPLAGLVERLLPARPEPEHIIVRPKFLDKELLGAPALALAKPIARGVLPEAVEVSE